MLVGSEVFITQNQPVISYIGNVTHCQMQVQVLKSQYQHQQQNHHNFEK